MWCDNLSNVIGPLKSRCVCIRVPRPAEGELFAYLVYIALRKNADPDMMSLVNIVKHSECNIKKAVWCLQHYILKSDYKTNYDEAIDNIVKLILSCDLKKIEEMRDIFFNIWITNYEGIKIVRDIVKELTRSTCLTEECKLNIVVKMSELEYNMMRGRREIIHFDAFVTCVMRIMKYHNVTNKKKN
jgi:replication factor C subunit 3/5